MATRKTVEERIAECDNKIEQIKAQKKAILQREKEAARKARTKRLIQIGAEVEAYCGEIRDLNAFKSYLAQYSYAIKKKQPSTNEAAAEAAADATTCSGNTDERSD